MTTGNWETEPQRNVIHPYRCTSTEEPSVTEKHFSRLVCPLTLSALVGISASSCGGDVAAIANANNTTVTDASTNQYVSANMSLLTNDQWEAIRSAACGLPITFELFTDTGPSLCGIILPVQNAGGATVWCPTPAFVLSLASGERYAIHFASDCSRGGVVKDPNNPDVGAMFCPTTCAVIEQSAGCVLQVVESCGGCGLQDG